MSSNTIRLALAHSLRRTLDISVNGWLVARMLYQDGDTSQWQISASTFMSKAQVSRAIPEFEQAEAGGQAQTQTDLRSHELRAPT
jgi:DNA-binding MarR family transcriptional regulator